MRFSTAVISIAALALPLCAAAQDRPNTTTTVLAVPPAAQGGDSPLVRAAKANANTKKADIVITNETLTRAGGHFASMNIVTTESGTQKPSGETDIRSRRNAAALTLQRLKDSTADYYKTLAPPVAAAPAQPQPLPIEGQRMPTTEFGHMTTTQLGTASTTPVETTGTTQMNQASTSEVAHSTTTQPPSATTTKPPER